MVVLSLDDCDSVTDFIYFDTFDAYYYLPSVANFDVCFAVATTI